MFLRDNDNFLISMFSQFQCGRPCSPTGTWLASRGQADPDTRCTAPEVLEMCYFINLYIYINLYRKLGKELPFPIQGVQHPKFLILSYLKEKVAP